MVGKKSLIVKITLISLFMLCITASQGQFHEENYENHQFLTTQDMSKSVKAVKIMSDFISEKLQNYLEQEQLDILINTFNKRPYVFVMILYYIFAASKCINFKFMLQFMVLGYTVALLAEYSSINDNIIPVFGRYYYIYENLQNEIMFLGVPMWDSISFVFMCFSGLTAARIAFKNQLFVTSKQKLKLVLVSAAITTLFDIIVDPLAHQGNKWFLGKMYYYPQPGYYFDITYLNFQGWYIVSFVINFCGVFLFQFEENQKLCNLQKNTTKIQVYFNRFIALSLVYGITLFGLVGYYIEEYKIFCLNTSYTLILTIFMFRQRQNPKKWKQY